MRSKFLKVEVKSMKFNLLLMKLKRKIFKGGYSNEELRSYGIVMGENCHVLTTKIDVHHGFLISMGDNVTISDARLLTHDGSTKKFLGYSRVGRIKIGSNVFIGAGAIILPGIEIEDNVVVGAGAIVTKDIPRDSLVVGNPARVIKTVTEYIQENKNHMRSDNVWDTHYSSKSLEEKQEMMRILAEGDIGYDL